MADELAAPERLDEIAGMVSCWLAGQLETNPAVVAVEHDPGRRRWHVRLHGEDRGAFALWLTLGQRTLQFETYVMPAPHQSHAAFYEHLLRRNRSFNGMAFCIGDEDAIYLAGQLPVGALDEGELDRVLGETYVYVEHCFPPAMQIGFGQRPRGDSPTTA